MKSTWVIYAAGIVLTCLIGYNYVYVPHQRQGRLIQAQIAKEQQHQRTQAEVADALQHIERYRKRLPEDADPSWIVQELVPLAQSAGIQLTSITQQPPHTIPQFTRLTVDVQFAASYHQLGAFIDAIERSKRFIRVERMNVARGEPATQHVPVQLALSTLYLPPLVQP